MSIIKNLKYLLFCKYFIFSSLFAEAATKAGKETKGTSSQATITWIVIGAILALIIGLVVYLNHKEKLRAKAAWEARKALILEKYGEKIGNLILDKQIAQGMTEEMLFESWGEPGKQENNVLRGNSVTYYYYGGSRNQRGNVKFAQRVTVENGEVIGWKDGNF